MAPQASLFSGGEKLTDARSQIVQGLTFYKNQKNGFSVLELHYSADPAKRSTAWRERESIGIGSTDWDREYELSWVVKTGRPVYTDFSHSYHRFGPSTIRGDVTLSDDSILVIGHDLGPTANRMAASFNIFERTTNRRWTVDEVYCEKASVDEYLDIVEHTLLRWRRWPSPIHVVDPTAIENISRIEEKACADLMRLRFGEPIAGERSFIKRRKSVEDVLTSFHAGVPSYNVHERCTMHIEGFEGGYHYKQLPASTGGGYSATPVKNGFSDIHDALQYAFSVAAGLLAPPVEVNKNSWVNTYVTGTGGVQTPGAGPRPLPSHIQIGSPLG
jgi:hypothetical protein